MSDINIEVAAGSSVRLLTEGKYCDKNILVTALSGGADSELPSGYTKLDYIQCSGGQYFDTLFTPNTNTRIEVKFMWHGGTGGYLFGAVDTNNAKALTATLDATGGNWRFDGTKYKYAPTANTTYIAKIDSTGLTINGTLYKYEGTVSTFTALNTLAVCGGKNSNGTMATAYFVGKIYYFKIYDNGTIIRDYIPCNNASGAVGMYDTVNGVFYENEGTGEFIGGEIVEPSQYPIWTGGYY